MPPKDIEADESTHVWQDREIKFDQPSQVLKFRDGEFQIDSMNAVEDTKGNNGDRGVMIITNLRILWATCKSNVVANLSIGWSCVTTLNVRVVSSKFQRGSAQALVVLTKFNNARFEFIFTSLVANSPRVFTSVQAVYRAYDSTKLYRDLKLRGAIIQDKELVRLPQEQIYDKIQGIWNLSSDQGNLGCFIITNVRVVWFAVLAENFNVSIPYLQIKLISVRSSKFGPALVIETTAQSGGYILGFRVDPPSNLEQLRNQVANLWRVFAKNPVFGVEYTTDAPRSAEEAMPLPRQEDDVQIVEDQLDPCLLYYQDGDKEVDREVAYNPDIGLAMEKLREGISVGQLWNPMT